jgi:hypothetical protein
MYPQEVTVAYPNNVKLVKIRTITKGVKKMSVLACTNQHPNNFEEIYEKEFDENSEASGGYQEGEERVEGVEARFIKLIIKEGWEDFASVHLVETPGQSLGGGESMEDRDSD